MKEFMLYVRNPADHKSTMPPEQHQEFLNKCSTYIEQLKAKGQLIAAQPLASEGILLSTETSEWKIKPYDETDEVQVGYYHILAEDLEEAISIAKGNPEFDYGTTARVEVRPVKTKEVTTGYEYPKNNL